MSITLRNNLESAAEAAGFQRTAVQRAVTAGMRSPILDLEPVEYTQENFSEGMMWLLDSTWILPLTVKPFLKQYIASYVHKRPVKFSGDEYGDAAWSLAEGMGMHSIKPHQEAAAAIQKSRDRVRVKKTPKGFALSLCMGQSDIADWAYDVHGTAQIIYGKRWSEVTWDGLDSEKEDSYAIRQQRITEFDRGITEQLIQLFGVDTLKPEVPIDVRLNAKDVFADSPAANNRQFQALVEKMFGTEFLDGFDALSAFRASVKSVRIVGTPTTARSSLRVYERNTADNSIIEVDSAEAALGFKKAGQLHWYYEWAKRVYKSRDYYIYLECELKTEDASAMVQSQNPDDITQVDIADWIQQWYHYQESGENVWKVRRLKDVAKANQQFAESGVAPRTRMSPDRLSLHPEGFLMFIPEVNNLETYESTMAQNIDREDGELSYNNVKYNHLRWHEDAVGIEHIEDHKNRESPANRLMFVDWYNNKLSYTNTAGVQSTLDLERCVPVNETHLRRYLDIAIKGGGGSEDAAWAMITAASKRMQQQGIDLWTMYMTPGEDPALLLKGKRYDEFKSLVTSGDVRQAFIMLNDGVDNAMHGLVSGMSRDDMMNKFPDLAEIADKIKLHEIDPAKGMTFYKGFGQILVKAAENTLEHAEDVIRERSVLTGLRELGLMTVINKYLNQYEAVKKRDLAMRKSYLEPTVLGKKYVPQDFAMLGGALTDTGFQPHQSRISDSLTNSPQYAILRVQAGGGKTIQILTNILYELGKGSVKRPVVICPAHLVRDYVREANFVTQGRLNMICINTESLESWGEEALLELVQAAPINTIVVTDYDFMKNRMVKTSYGREILSISLNCEMLRQMDFDGAWLDESHLLRKVNQRSVSCGRLLAEIPFKRIATGTLLIDQLTDVANQFGVFDPTVFGTPERFIEKYAQQVSGGKVMKWKPNAERDVMRLMEQYSMVLTANRREWAALLPPRREKLYFVELSEAQRGLYNSILEETLEKIKAEDPDLYRLLMSNVGDEDADSIEGLLGPYLARLEQFLTSPAEDDAAIALSEQDKISPKGTMIADLCRKHIDAGIPGKILIFTSFKASAKTIYDQLPQDLKDMCIHYTAAEKFKCAQQFERDDTKKIMVGVEVSMNTGLNLQMASRLIRVESVWSPGLLEQGESRINRPKLKGKDLRTAIYFDWVIVNRTIDITKIGRLIGKLVSSIKFENTYEPEYQNLPDVPLVSMNLESLMANNDVDETLKEHLDAFYKLRDVQEKDYENYRTDPKIDKSFKPVAAGKILDGAAYLKEVPYVSGMDLFGAEDLGLVHYHEFIRDNHKAESDPRGLMIHTEWGDGEVIGMSKNRLRVRLNSGDKVSVPKMAAFIVTRDKVSTKTIRSQLAKLAGLKPAEHHEMHPTHMDDSPVEQDMPEPKKSKKVVKDAVEEPVEVVPQPKPGKKHEVKPIQDGVADGGIDLTLGIVNGGLCINTDGNDPDIIFGQLKKYGFMLWDKAYWYMPISTAAQMRMAIDKLAANFTVPKSYLADLEFTYTLFKQGKAKLLHPDAANKAEFRNFFMDKRRKPETGDTVKPYVYITDYDGSVECMLIVDAINTPAASQLKAKARVTGTVWSKDTDMWAACYCPNHAHVNDVMMAMKKDGIVINNLDDFRAAFKALKPIRRAGNKADE